MAVTFPSQGSTKEIAQPSVVSNHSRMYVFVLFASYGIQHTKPIGILPSLIEGGLI